VKNSTVTTRLIFAMFDGHIMTRRTFTALACALLAMAWVVCRIQVFANADTIQFPDSASYLVKAASPLSSLDFYFDDGRFFIVPLVYKLAASLCSSNDCLTAAQLVLSLLAWLYFAWAATTRAPAGWVAVASWAAVLALGLTGAVIQWDTAILSESVTTSVWVALVAAWLRLAEGVTGRRVAWLLAISGVWSMTREANSLMLMPFGVVLVCWSVWYLPAGRQRITCWLIASIWVAFVAVTFTISGHGERWFIPMLNVIGKRVLPAPDRTAFYRARGMPLNDALTRMSGEFASGKDLAFFTDPDLEAFRTWLRARGRRTYADDLLTHPGRTLTEPLQDVGYFVCPDLSPYVPSGYQPVLPDLGRSFCVPPRATALVAGSFLVGAALLILAWLRRQRELQADGFWMVTIAALLMGWQPFVWLSWHIIGGMEVSRHVLSGTLEFRVGIVLLMLYVAQRSGHALRDAKLVPARAT
jgi:hypothetical protein